MRKFIPELSNDAKKLKELISIVQTGLVEFNTAFELHLEARKVHSNNLYNAAK